MDLKKIADETKAELPVILGTIPDFHAADSSIHDLTDLPVLDPAACPGHALPSEDVEAGKKGTRIRVYDMDTFDAALLLAPDYKVHTHLELRKPGNSNVDSDIVMKDASQATQPSDGTPSKSDNTATTTKPVAVLNLASERSPGGGWSNGALAQEECLCYRSSLSLSLHKSYYPIPSLSAIYTPSVLLLRDSMSAGHALLTPATPPTDLPVVSVISLAALRKPQLTYDQKSFRNVGQRAETKRKIRVTLRVAVSARHTKVVLGALGCGVFANPPGEVAMCFLEVLRETEFQGGWWEEVAFAVLDNINGADGGKNGDGNFGIFWRALDGQVV